MLVKIKGSALVGINAITITVEVNVSMGQGYTLVGLPDSSVKESLHRTESAIKANGLFMPRTKLLVNLSPAEIKKALFSGNTVVWYDDLLIGKEDQIKQLVSENIRFGKMHYQKDKTILQLDVVNESSVPVQLEYLGAYSFHQRATVFTLAPKTTARLQIKTVVKKEAVSLPFRILNAVIGPKKYLEHTFLVK